MSNQLYINSIPYEASIITANNGLEYYSLNVKKSFRKIQYIFNLNRQLTGDDSRCFLAIIKPDDYDDFLKDISKFAKGTCGESCWNGGLTIRGKRPLIIKSDNSKKIIYAFIEGEWQI